MCAPLSLASTLCCCSFGEVFSRDEAGLPRTWGPRADVPGAAAEARAAAAHLLALLAVFRLDLPQPAAAVVDASIASLAEQHVCPLVRVLWLHVSSLTCLHFAPVVQSFLCLERLPLCRLSRICMPEALGCKWPQA